MMEAVNRGADDAAVSLFSHPRFELVGLNRVYDGRDEVLGYLHDRRLIFPDQQYEPIALHHSDDAVIAELWMLGTASGTIGGVPATGRGFRCRMASFFIFEGDDLVCQRLYFDLGTIARQLA